MESPGLMTYAVEFSIGVTESLSAYLVAVRLFRTIAFIVLPRLGCLLSLNWTLLALRLRISACRIGSCSNWLRYTVYPKLLFLETCEHLRRIYERL